MEGIATDFPVHNLMAMVQDFQTLDRPNGEVEEGEERHALARGECIGPHCIDAVGTAGVGAEVVPVWPKIDQIAEEVWAGGLEDAGDQLALARLCGQANKFNWTDKVFALGIRLFDDELGEVELAL